MHDIIFISADKDTILFKEFKKKYPFAKQASTYSEAKSKAFTKLFWLVWDDVIVNPNFNFKFEIPVWDHKYIHVFRNGEYYDGICLSSNDVSVSEREFKHRFFINKKEIDLQLSVPKQYDIFNIDTYEEYLQAMESSTTDMFWMSSDKFKIVDTFKFDIYFSHHNSYDRQQNHSFKHFEDGKETYDGVMLCSKFTLLSKKEINYRFLINKKEWDVVASTFKLYDIFNIDTYEEYLQAMESSTTDMFWMTTANLKVEDTFKFDLFFSKKNFEQTYDRNQNHVFVHKVADKKLYNGIFLCSKNKPISKKEIEFRHLIERKEWDIVASGPVQYDIFEIDTYEDYQLALARSTTELFWVIPKEVEVLPNFKFDLYFSHDNVFDRKTHHVFKNKDSTDIRYTGLMLTTKHFPLSKKEINFRFIIEKKEHDVLASQLKNYDIVFISYNEPNADENFAILKDKYPTVKRVHGVKGIHQAHIEAAKISNTCMFWVVDADAIVVDNFDFSYLISRYERDIVHVWQSRNPINNLVYGYGGIKLLPKDLTINVDITSPDMTTSISSKFKAMPSVSNITAFNTDPFSTWKSAFRECVKLASRSIQGQVDEETAERLNVWCTVANGNYGEYAILGALAGQSYGQENAGNKPALALINDFDWLKNQFQQIHQPLEKSQQ